MLETCWVRGQAMGRAEDAVSLKAALEKQIGSRSICSYFKGTGIMGAPTKIFARRRCGHERQKLWSCAWAKTPLHDRRSRSRTIWACRDASRSCWRRIAATGKPVILILFSGRPLTLPWAFEHVPAVLRRGFPGFRRDPRWFVPCSERRTLPANSWSVGHVALVRNRCTTTRSVRVVRPIRNSFHPAQDSEEKYVSRYIDEQNTPQFPLVMDFPTATFRYGTTEVDYGSSRRLNFRRRVRTDSAKTSFDSDGRGNQRECAQRR